MFFLLFPVLYLLLELTPPLTRGFQTIEKSKTFTSGLVEINFGFFFQPQKIFHFLFERII